MYRCILVLYSMHRYFPLSDYGPLDYPYPLVRSVCVIPFHFHFSSHSLSSPFSFFFHSHTSPFSFFFFFILLIHPFHFSSILSLHPFHFLLFIPILCRFLYLPLPLPSPLLSHVSIFPSLSLSLFILSSHLCFAFFVPPHQPFLFFFSLLYLSLYLSLYTLSSH